MLSMRHQPPKSRRLARARHHPLSQNDVSCENIIDNRMFVLGSVFSRAAWATHSYHSQET